VPYWEWHVCGTTGKSWRRGHLWSSKRCQAKLLNRTFDLERARFMERHTGPGMLLGPAGERIPLPAEVYGVLVNSTALRVERRRLARNRS
jgi:hypothetical protein